MDGREGGRDKKTLGWRMSLRLDFDFDQLVSFDTLPPLLPLLSTPTPAQTNSARF